MMSNGFRRALLAGRFSNPAAPARRHRRLPALIDFLEPRCLLSATPVVGISKIHDGSEINGSTTGAIVFAVTRAGGDLTQTLTVNYTVDAASTAIGGNNYTVPSGTVTILAHQTKALITIPVLNDGVADPAETLKLDAATSGTYTVIRAKATATANIADAAPTVSISKLHDGSEADGAGKGAAVFVVSRVGKDLSQPLTVSYSVDPSSTATGGSDYIIPSGTVTIPAGQKSAQIVITIKADTVIDPNETIVLDLTGDPAYHLDPKATKDTATAKIKDVPAADFLAATQLSTTGHTWNYAAHSGPAAGTGIATLTTGTASNFIYDNQLTANGSGKSLEFALDTTPGVNGTALNSFHEITPEANFTLAFADLVLSPNILAGTFTSSSNITTMLSGVTLTGTAHSTIKLSGVKTLTVPDGTFTADQITWTLNFKVSGTVGGHAITASGTNVITFYAVPGTGIIKTTISSHLSEKTPQGSGSETISANEVLTSIT